MAMEAESPARKLSYMIQGIVWTILFATMGGIYLSYMVNANNWDDYGSSELGVDNFYDDMFWGGLDYTSAEVIELRAEVLEWDTDKYDLGSRYSVIYAFCGVTFVMIAVANCCISIGAYNLQARMLGGCCGCCFGCVNFSALITTAVFRFNAMGKLAALSTTPTKYEGVSEREVIASDDTTYETDASTILALWIVQLLACVCSCCVAGFLNKPPSQEELARAMQSQGMGVDGPMTHH